MYFVEGEDKNVQKYLIHEGSKVSVEKSRF